MFGGGGVDETGIGQGVLNELWKFDPRQNTWTWVSGSKLYSQVAVYGTQGKPDPANTPGGLYAPAMWADRQGRLWVYGGRD